MKRTLEILRSSRRTGNALLRDIELWLLQMEPVKYDCLGCEHCFPAEAMKP